jgi:hypothetical protein
VVSEKVSRASELKSRFTAGISMFRLCLHYPYTHVAEAIDVSGADNHGRVRDVSFVPNGTARNSGALSFDVPSSRVAVVDRPAFAHLHALKIETVVRVRSLGQRRNLVEGHLSFAFYIHGNGVMQGTYLGRTSPGGPLTWQGVETHMDTPDGITRLIPINRWVKLTYLHDGFASLRLFVDDELAAAKYNFSSPIRPVGWRGVHIGNWPDADAYNFDGEIDDVRIWRWEPNAAYYQFFCRRPGKCWKEIYGRIGEWAAGPEGRERLRQLLLCIGMAQTEIIRSVRSQGEDAIKRNDDFARRYRDLWCRNAIDGDEMKALLSEWLAWLQELIGRTRFAELLQQMKHCFKATGLGDDWAGLRDFEVCDPAFAAYIRTLMDLDPA